MKTMQRMSSREAGCAPSRLLKAKRRLDCVPNISGGPGTAHEECSHKPKQRASKEGQEGGSALDSPYGSKSLQVLGAEEERMLRIVASAASGQSGSKLVPLLQLGLKGSKDWESLFDVPSTGIGGAVRNTSCNPFSGFEMPQKTQRSITRVF